MRKALTVTLVVFFLSLNAIASAQPGRGRQGGGFNASEAQIGEPFPALKCFTADGKEFNLNQLKGNYSVLVFGCLT